MRRLLLITMSLILIFVPVTCFATDDFATGQALALYSATEDGNSIIIADDGVLVNDRKVTVTFSSDNLVSNSSEFSVIAYKPQGDDATPSKDNIYYLNQLVYTNGTVSFEIPSDAPIGVYVLLMGGSDLSSVARVTFGIEFDTEGIILGDVNNDSVFNTLDVIKLKKYIAKDAVVVSRWTDRDTYAADFDKDGYANILDAVLMREAIANRVID